MCSVKGTIYCLFSFILYSVRHCKSEVVIWSLISDRDCLRTIHCLAIYRNWIALLQALVLFSKRWSQERASSTDDMPEHYCAALHFERRGKISCKE